MKNYFKLLLLALLVLPTSLLKANGGGEKDPIEGRWDLTVNIDGRMAPSWLEVRHTGINGYFGRFVWEGGSARPISKVEFKDGKVSFHIPAQWERTDKELVLEGTLADSKLSGSIVNTNGKTYSFVGERAPKLWRDKAPVWGAPIKLFNGKDLTGWEALGKTNQWIVENGVLKSPKSGANIRTVKTFDDFKLHIEFRYPKGSNSGVYLRGRYEIQIEDNKGMEPMSLYLGGIYGFIDPWLNMAKEPGEWQSYDVELVGRMVTVKANGTTIIYKQEIPGVTGGALDSKEGEPGPLMMQGDHGPIEFRNIVLTPAIK
jgi:Domain of Unknown Function (DUF1080)